MGNIREKSMLVVNESQKTLESGSVLRNRKILNRLNAVR